jgi:hypothetical protein
VVPSFEVKILQFSIFLVSKMTYQLLSCEGFEKGKEFCSITELLN